MITLTKSKPAITSKGVFTNCFNEEAIYNVDNVIQAAQEGEEIEIILNEENENEPSITCKLSFDTTFEYGYTTIEGLEVEIIDAYLNHDTEVQLTSDEEGAIQEEIKELILKTVA